MSKPKQKFYVVWVGRQPGVYLNWADCQAQIDGFPKAKFKSFFSQKAAEEAFAKDSSDFIQSRTAPVSKLPKEELQRIGDPIEDSIAVDGAWNTNTGVVEYQGVYNKTYETLFHVGPLEDGTNNIVEFLAIVHALALCKQWYWDIPIYSDSKTALAWVKSKRARTDHPVSEKNKKLFDLIRRAEHWLANNEYRNPLLKWETKAWGENPADFGRK